MGTHNGQSEGWSWGPATALALGVGSGVPMMLKPSVITWINVTFPAQLICGVRPKLAHTHLFTYVVTAFVLLVVGEYS